MPEEADKGPSPALESSDSDDENPPLSNEWKKNACKTINFPFYENPIIKIDVPESSGPIVFFHIDSERLLWRLWRTKQMNMLRKLSTAICH